jgi:hypothetical protein
MASLDSGESGVDKTADCHDPRQGGLTINDGRKAGQSSLLEDSRAQNAIEPGKVLVKICVALGLDAVLARAVAVRCSFAVALVKRVDHVHAAYDLGERGEARGIQPWVVFVANEDLRRARVGLPGLRESDEASQVRLRHRVVGDGLSSPHLGDLRIARDSKLHHEVGDRAKEARVVVEPELHEVVKAVRSVGCPRSMYLEHERASGRRELGKKDLRRFGRRKGRVELGGCVVRGDRQRWRRITGGGRGRPDRRDGLRRQSARRGATCADEKEDGPQACSINHGAPSIAASARAVKRSSGSEPKSAGFLDGSHQHGHHRRSHSERFEVLHRHPANIGCVVARAGRSIVDRHEKMLVDSVGDPFRGHRLAAETLDQAGVEAGFLHELAHHRGLERLAVVDAAARDRPGTDRRLAATLDEKHAARSVDDYRPDGDDGRSGGLRGRLHRPILALPMIGIELVRPLEAEWRSVLDAVANARGWPSSRDVGKLGAAVADLSAAYNDPRRARASAREAGAARLGFAFARDVPKGAGAVRELVATGGLPQDGVVRVLDLGAGLGAMTWGLVRALRASGSRAVVDATWVDTDPGALALSSDIVRERYRDRDAEFRVRTLRGTLDAASGLGRFDLVLLGNVLSELSTDSPDEVRRREHVAFLGALLERNVLERGAVVVVEPALRARTRHLHGVRDELCQEGVSVFAPCLHQAACPALARESDWCHEALPVDLPDWLVPIARAAGLRFERLTFSYLVLGKGMRSLRDAIQAPASAGRLRVVSEVISSKGKREAFMCGAFSSPGAADGVVAARARVSRLTRDERGDDISSRAPLSTLWASLSQGELLVIDPAPALEAPRVGRGDRVEVVGFRPVRPSA